MRKYGTELLTTNYPISFYRQGSGHMGGAILLVKVTEPSRNNIMLKLLSKMPVYAEKICDMCTLLKYAKSATISEYAAVAYSHKTDIRIYDMIRYLTLPKCRRKLS